MREEMTEQEQDRRREWHLDRKVTITLILAITLQGAAAVWFASEMRTVVEANTRAIIQLQQRQDAVRTEIPSRLVRIEVGLETLLRRIDRDYDRERIPQ